MRIGLVLPGFSASEDDWCIPALLDLVRTLSQTPGNEVEIFALRYPDQRTSYPVYGSTVHPLGGVAAHRSRRIGLWTRAVNAIAREHRRAPFDLLHAFWADEPGLVATMAAKRLRIPAVVSLAGGELVGFPDIGYGGQLHRSSRLMTRLTLRLATQVTVGSNYLARLAAAHASRKKIAVLPLGVDTDLFRPAATTSDSSPFSPSPEAVNILNVASLVAIKDQTTLLRAASRLIEMVPNAHLHLVGEGPLYATLQREVNQLDITGHVHFHGPVAHEALPTFYRAADCCVLTSRHEAQAMVVLEAAAVGRVTIGTAVGLLPDFCPADVVPVGNVPNLARVMIDLAQSAALRQQRGEEALNKVEREYSLDQITREWLKLYDSIATRAGSTSPEERR